MPESIGRKRYRRRPGQNVVAAQLLLDTDGFTYRKWGSDQRCKRGDWLVNSGSNAYTVDADVFARTYREVQPGSFIKITPVWAEVAPSDGSLATKEGRTAYKSGDYLVFNNEDGSDGYAMGAEKFQAMYEPDE